MIASLSGLVRERDGESIVLDVAGVGYEVYLPPIVWKELDEPLPEQPLSLEIVYQASAQQPKPVLFGFLHREQKELFELLSSIPRMGGRNAAKAMTIPVPELARAIHEGNVALLSRLPGVSITGADKLVAALRKKVVRLAGPPTTAVDSARGTAREPEREQLRQAVDFLEGMGVRKSEAEQAVDEILAEQESEIHSLQDVITEFFRRRNRAVTL